MEEQGNKKDKYEIKSQLSSSLIKKIISKKEDSLNKLKMSNHGNDLNEQVKGNLVLKHYDILEPSVNENMQQKHIPILKQLKVQNVHQKHNQLNSSSSSGPLLTTNDELNTMSKFTSRSIVNEFQQIQNLLQPNQKNQTRKYKDPSSKNENVNQHENNPNGDSKQIPRNIKPESKIIDDETDMNIKIKKLYPTLSTFEKKHSNDLAPDFFKKEKCLNLDDKSQNEDYNTLKSEINDIVSKYTGEQPWFNSNDYDLGLDPISRLHKEILMLYKYLSSDANEDTIRELLKDSVHNVVEKVFGRGAETHIFGSYKSGLHLPTSDIDLVIMVPYKKKPSGVLKELVNPIKKKFGTKKVEVRLFKKVKVPIIKFKEPISNLEIDISANEDNGVQSSIIIKKYLLDYPPLKPLVMLTKHFLYIYGKDKYPNGYISSYALTVMFIFFFQRIYPKDEKINFDQVNYGELLLRFLEFYSKDHNYKIDGIYLSDSGEFFKIDVGSNKRKDGTINTIWVKDPVNETSNLTTNSHGYDEIVMYFESAFKIIKSNLDRYNKHLRNSKKSYQASLLAPVFFVSQVSIDERHSLRKAYEQLCNL